LSEPGRALGARPGVVPLFDVKAKLMVIDVYEDLELAVATAICICEHSVCTL
jgi:hypothetical protein